MARGYLTRPWRDQSTNSNRATSDPNYGKFVGVGNPAEELQLQAINEAIEAVAKARGLSMAQISLAWQYSNPAVTAPIVGSTNLNSLIELAAASSLVLTDAEVESINAPYKPRSIMGHA